MDIEEQSSYKIEETATANTILLRDEQGVCLRVSAGKLERIFDLGSEIENCLNSKQAGISNSDIRLYTPFLSSYIRAVPSSLVRVTPCTPEYSRSENLSEGCELDSLPAVKFLEQRSARRKSRKGIVRTWLD